ncbi:MAG: Rid family detoxifying hydrolase [Gemmatimonadota bacterium]|nr:Rid family detoxifying hydrolase [Gemmatimonadota bacterium]MDH4352271.1 Rid family detoxifying hydrolase [Gemmatimonadota bacterium]MDH5196127.1 Rid family detoxifying hydrolase [Gemmatimonadota bacterium]
MRVGVIVAMVLAAGAGSAVAQQKQVIRMPGSLEGLPFSTAVRVDDVLFLSGQIGVQPGSRELVPGGIAEETRQTMENIKAVLEYAGSSMDRIVKCTVFLADMADYALMNTVYASFFPTDPPARSALGTTGLALGAAVEIECLALVGDAK